MKTLNKDLFVLVIGIAGGGTTGTRGLINLSPNFDIAFEKKQNNLEDSLEAVREKMKGDPFPDHFNGNKLALNRNNSSFHVENFIECIENRKIIMHDNFLRLKIIFVDRNSVDTVCSNHFKRIIRGKPPRSASLSEAIDNWLIRKKQIDFLKNYFKDSISFDFYSLILKEKTRKSLFEYLEDHYFREYFSSTLECNWYGRKKLDISNLTFNSLRNNNRYQKQMDLTRKEFIKKGISFE